MSDVSEKYGLTFLNIKDNGTKGNPCSVKIFELSREPDDSQKIKKLLLFPELNTKFGESIRLHFVGYKENNRPQLARCHIDNCKLCKLKLRPFDKVFFYGLYLRYQIVYLSLSPTAAKDMFELFDFFQKKNSCYVDLKDINHSINFLFRQEFKNKQVPTIVSDKKPLMNKEKILESINKLPTINQLLDEKYPDKWPERVISTMKDKKAIRKILLDNV